jgi:uncharacterized phage protein gp47/JayE
MFPECALSFSHFQYCLKIEKLDQVDKWFLKKHASFDAFMRKDAAKERENQKRSRSPAAANEDVETNNLLSFVIKVPGRVVITIILTILILINSNNCK